VVKYALEVAPGAKAVISKITKEIQLDELGIINSKLSQVSFYPGGVQKALIVNNNIKDPSLVEIDLTNIPWDFEMTINKNYKLSKKFEEKGLPPPGSQYDLEICHTINTIFIWSKTQHLIFGKSPDYVSKSEIQVPTMSRKILQMACGFKRETFQLLMIDDLTNTKYLTNYFGFDGLNANKKIHSDIVIDEKFEKFATTSYS
jgi:hypothetical protein